MEGGGDGGEEEEEGSAEMMEFSFSEEAMQLCVDMITYIMLYIYGS